MDKRRIRRDEVGIFHQVLFFFITKKGRSFRCREKSQVWKIPAISLVVTKILGDGTIAAI